MYVVIRKYTGPRDVIEEARPKLGNLEQVMRAIPGFVAYYFVETDDGLATVTVTDDERGGAESIQRAAEWVKQNLPQSGASISAPQVTRGQALLGVTR